MIDVATEKLMTLEQAADKLMLPKATLVKWIKYGTKGVKLEAIKFGTHWRTSEEALQRFGDRQTPTAEPTPVSRSVAETEYLRRAKDAGEALDILLGVRKCESCKKELNTYKKTISKGEKLWCSRCLVEQPNATFAQRLRTFRWEANLSQEQLSKKTGISIQDIRAYELSKKVPNDEDVAKFVEVLGVEMASDIDLK